MHGVCKAFSGVPTLMDVDFDVHAGEVVALLGENGAGKSTLMKILSGVYERDAGEITLDGAPMRASGIRQAERKGIVLVPQELHIAPNLSIAENMLMGMLPTRSCGFVDEAKLHAMAVERLAFFGVDAAPDTPMQELSPSAQRLVTIAAALSKSAAKVLILDEPTASLTHGESEHLFAHIRQIRQKHVGCIYITHRLDEIAHVADRVVVMRNGRVVARFDTAQAPISTYVSAMIGRDLAPESKRTSCSKGHVALSVRDLCVYEHAGDRRCRVDHASFDLHHGEILGIFGLVGAGRTELAKAIFGAWMGRITGDLALNGQTIAPRSPAHAIALGLAMLTEDRKRTGLIEGQTVSSNISAASIRAVARGPFVREAQETARNQALVAQLDLRPPRLDVHVEAFSGGNQQKVLLARWIATKPRVLIVDEPTYGVDVGARYEIYRLLGELAAGGSAVLMISSDVNEMLHESDRILVMYKGRMAGEFDGRTTTRRQLMMAANGGLA